MPVRTDAAVKTKGPVTVAATAPRDSVIEIVDRLIAHGVRRRASDIHVEPAADRVRVRLRADGLLEESAPLPKTLLPEVVARIKVMARLRTDEHQAAQDGRFRAVLRSAGPVDVRVSIMPTSHGENAVLRLLPARSPEESLESLGFPAATREAVERALARPQGLILATGPTGSGKTTTLYALLAERNGPGVSVATIEDPIEYAMDGVTQIAANTRAGLGFAAGLRALLRQDPDVLMVGEIRDEETAALAVNAALTGHLVLSTLHTNDAASAVIRLLDLGVAPYLVASTLSLVIGQRLLRATCPGCRKDTPLSETEKTRLSEVAPPGAVDGAALRTRGTGCAACNGSGHAGRLGTYEALVVDDALREVVLRRGTAAELKRTAVASGLRTMAEDGWSKAVTGQTTFEEVLRVLA